MIQKIARYSFLILILIIIIIMYYGIFNSNEQQNISPLIGKNAPDFQVKTFDEQLISLSDLKGKTIVLNFWSSWCIPCIEEVSTINKFNLKYNNKEIEFIGVNIWDDYNNALSFITKYGLNYKSGTDPKGVIQVEYGVSGVPETFFINADGIVTEKFSGQLNDNILTFFLNKTLSDSLNES